MVSYQKNIGLCVVMVLPFALGAAQAPNGAVVSADRQVGFRQMIADGKKGITPLHRAAEQAHVAQLLRLLEQDDCGLLSQKDTNGKTALDYAREAKKDNIIGILTQWPLFKQQALKSFPGAKRSDAFLAGLHQRCGAGSTVRTLPISIAQAICRYAMQAERASRGFGRELSKEAVSVCKNYYHDLLCQAAAAGNENDLRIALACGAGETEEGFLSERRIDKTALYQAVSHYHCDLIPALKNYGTSDDRSSDEGTRRELINVFSECIKQDKGIAEVKDIVEKVTEDYRVFRYLDRFSAWHSSIDNLSANDDLSALFAHVVARGDLELFDFLFKKWDEQNRTGDPEDKKHFLRDVIREYFTVFRNRNPNLRAFEALLQQCSKASVGKDLTDARFCCIAIEEKNYELLQLLLKYGFDVDGFWTSGTPLAVACKYDDWRAVKMLLESGAPANNLVKGPVECQSCFEYCYERKQFELMQIALKHWPFEDRDVWSIKQTLIKAFGENDLERAEMLLAWGQKQGKQGKNVLIGDMSLYEAIHEYNVEYNVKKVELLLRYGADPHEGIEQISLMYKNFFYDQRTQKYREHIYQITELFLKYGAKAGVKPENMHNLLWTAIHHNDLQMCNLIWSNLGCFMPEIARLDSSRCAEKLSPELEALWQKIQRNHEDRKNARVAHTAFLMGLHQRSGAQSDLSRLGVPVEMAQKICSWVIPGKTCDDWKKPAIGQQAPAAPVVPGLAPNGAGNASMWAIFGRLAHAFNRHRATAAVHGFCSAVTRGIGVLGRCLPLVNRMVRLLL